MAQVLMLLVIIAYMAWMVWVGIIYSRRNTSVDDFYLGGRKLGPFVTAMSAEASDMSSWLLMGLPGVAYLTGMAEAFWTALGLGIGTYLNWLFVARRIRRYSHRLDAITLPEFFSKRWGDDRNMLAAIAGIVIIVFFVPYTASGFSACGKLFSTVFDIGYVPAMIISGALIMLYTIMGGFMAASFTDLIQSIIMSIALVAVLGFGVVHAGGVGAVVENARKMAGYLSISSIYNPETGGSDPYSVLTMCSLLAWGLGYFGMPHILLRFMAIEDENKLKLARRVGSIWVFIAMGVGIIIGIVGNGMTAAGALEKLADSETIIVTIATLISTYGPFAALVAGLILAGILAATMSTADSQMLAASSSASKDVAMDFLGIKLTDRQSVILARGSMIVIGLIAMFIARDQNSSVFRVVSFAWAGFGATFAPAVLLALFWRRSNKWGALAGMIVGGVMVFVWHYLIAPLGGVWAIYELLPAFILSILANIIVSLFTPAPKKEITDMYDSYNQPL